MPGAQEAMDCSNKLRDNNFMNTQQLNEMREDIYAARMLLYSILCRLKKWEKEMEGNKEVNNGI